MHRRHLYGLHSAPVHAMLAYIMKPIALSIMAAALALATAGSASAHPHVWVTTKTAVVYGPDGTVVGLRHAWTFDDMYSAFAIQGLEQKTKGEFTREELQSLAQVNVESLKEYDFFTYAKANGKKTVFEEPKEYHLEFDPKATTLTLHFLLPLKTPTKAKTFNLEVFDPSYFVDFQPAEKDAVELVSAPQGCQLATTKPQEMTKELARRLAEIPADGQIPENSWGAQFTSKISVQCP